MFTSWRIELMGGLSASRAERDVIRFQTRKTGSLLALLAYYVKRAHSRDEIIEQIWPDAPWDRARMSLSTALTSLRHQLEPPDVPPGSVIIADHSHVRLNVAAVTTDVMDFAAAVYTARSAANGSERLPLLIRAIDAYRGELLPGVFANWVMAERERLAAAYIGILREAAMATEAAGDLNAACEYLLRAISAAPAREEVHLELMRLYGIQGRHSDAVRQYDLLKKVLERDMGRRPSDAARRLARELRQGLRRPSTDFHPPIRRKQYEIERMPTQRSPASHPVPRLPARLTQFFGRENDVQRLINLLNSSGRDGTHRLLTLVGPGGCGKTRLALEVADRLSGTYGGRVAFTSCAGMTDPQDLPSAILDALAIQEQAGSSAMDQVLAHLCGDPFLLVVDNVEHLGERCSQTIWSLIQVSPLTRLLVTSRQPLGIDGERQFPVRPLEIPPPLASAQDLMSFAAVKMFIDRAQPVCPDFQITPRNASTIAAICQRLEGIPLAIELAAARAQALAPAQILEQLSERLEFLVNRRRTVQSHHQTLRTAFDWSYELLTDELKTFFCRLSAFQGGFTLKAAESVCDAPNALGLLEDLLERSLLFMNSDSDESRFSMLETQREYADEKLSPVERERTRRSHAAHYLSQARQAETGLRGPDARYWIQRLEPETDNLRAALAALRGTGEGLSLAAGLWRFWLLRGRFEEGRRWLAAMLETDQDVGLELRANALNGMAILAHHQGSSAEARTLLEESLAICRDRGHAWGLAETLNNLAVVYEDQQQYEEARSLTEECLALRRNLGDTWGEAASLNNLGRMLQAKGDLAAASRCYEQSQSLYQDLNDWSHASLVLNNLGSAEFEQGNLARARAAYEHSLELSHNIGNRWCAAILRHNLGEVLCHERLAHEAAPLLRESLETLWELGDRASIAQPLASFGMLAALDGDYVRAIRLFSASTSVCSRFNVSVSPTARRLLEADIAAARDQLSKGQGDAAWAYGQTLSVERAVSYALQEVPALLSEADNQPVAVVDPRLIERLLTP